MSWKSAEARELGHCMPRFWHLGPMASFATCMIEELCKFAYHSFFSQNLFAKSHNHHETISKTLSSNDWTQLLLAWLLTYLNHIEFFNRRRTHAAQAALNSELQTCHKQLKHSILSVSCDHVSWKMLVAYRLKQQRYRLTVSSSEWCRCHKQWSRNFTWIFQNYMFAKQWRVHF